MNSAEKIYHVLSRRARKTLFKRTGLDFKNGFRSIEKKEGKYYLAFDAEGYFGIDARGEWEANRFQELLPEAIAFLKTGERKRAERIIQHISIWIDENPFGYGINWLCAMEVGIRAANWLLTWRIISDKIQPNKAFLKKFLKSIEEHRSYIEQNLEVTYKSPLANHYLSDVAGLLYIALLHPRRTNKQLLKRSLQHLEGQIRQQVFDDGVAFENSIAYHRYVLEIFFYSALLCREAGVEVSREYWQRLEKMLDFTLYYTRPDGLAPGFGDSDDGLWHSFFKDTKENITDHRYLLSLAAVVFKRGDFKQAAGTFYPEFSSVFKSYTTEAWAAVSEIAEPISSRAFKNGGIYIMRYKDIYLSIITANAHTHPQQLHKHNDIGSFELCAGNAPFIVDSGTYCYTSTPDVREYFRSTAAHNTLLVDGQEQQNLKAAGFFALPRTANPVLQNWDSDKRRDELSFSYLQFFKDSSRVEITRNVLFKKEEKTWRIEDKIEGSGEHDLQWSFHLHPESEVFLKDGFAEIHLRGKILKIITSGNKAKIEKADISFAFGQKQPSHVIRFLKKTLLPHTGIFELQVI